MSNSHNNPALCLRWANASDIPAIFTLFEACFGQQISLAHWYWKYGAENELSGMIVVESGRALAFYGGVARSISLFGTTKQAIQIGDVMVSPSARGIGGGRNSLFTRMAKEYLAMRVGYDRPALVAYGFPSFRALRLGELLGHYRRTDQIIELHWTSGATKNWHLRTRHWCGDNQSIDFLWLAMASDFQDCILGVRDSAYVQHRYNSHPSISYLLFLVTNRFSGKPCGLLVLRSHQETLELVDLICVKKHIPELVRVARRVAKQLGKKTLFMWVAEAQAHLLTENGDDQPVIKALGIWVPANVSSPGPSPETLKGKWWLVGGDTDFH